MADANAYVPPKVWVWNKAAEARFAAINRPIAGPTHDKALPVGRHPLQLYSLGTPNGIKVTILLEELLALGSPSFRELQGRMAIILQGTRLANSHRKPGIVAATGEHMTRRV